MAGKGKQKGSGKMVERCLDLFYLLIGLTGMAGIVFFLLPSIMRLTPTVVMSGSMEPEISVGSVTYIAENIPPEDISEQDVISYRMGERVSVLHRVVTVDRECRTFCTKGDANQSADPGLVEYSQYEGKAVISIPYLGYVIRFFQSGMNRVWIIAGTVLLIAADRYRRSAERRRAI